MLKKSSSNTYKEKKTEKEKEMPKVEAEGWDKTWVLGGCNFFLRSFGHYQIQPSLGLLALISSQRIKRWEAQALFDGTHKHLLRTCECAVLLTFITAYFYYRPRRIVTYHLMELENTYFCAYKFFKMQDVSFKEWLQEKYHLINCVWGGRERWYSIMYNKTAMIKCLFDVLRK